MQPEIEERLSGFDGKLNCGQGIGLEWKCQRKGAGAKPWQQGYITGWAFW
jgi:hypothetical protein